MRYSLKSTSSKYKKWALMMTVAIHVGFFGAMALSGTTEKDDQIIQQVKDWFNKDSEQENTKKTKTKQA